MGREFVVKHIRNKHGHVLEAERERLQEEIFWENFKWGSGLWPPAGWRGCLKLQGLSCVRGLQRCCWVVGLFST